MIWQKLPLRVYLGFAPDKKFSVEEITYDTTTENFTREPQEWFNWNDLFKNLSPWFKQKESPEGWRIKVVFELNQTHGPLAATLLHVAALRHILNANKTFIEDIHTETESPQKLAKGAAILIDAWELSAKMWQYSTNSLSFASFVDSFSPIVYLSNVLPNPKEAKNAPYWGFRMGDLSKESSPRLPCDATLMYPGSAGGWLSRLSGIHSELKLKYRTSEKKARKLIGSQDQHYVPDWFEHLVVNAYDFEGQALSLRSIGILLALYDLYQLGGQASIVQQFLAAIHAARQMKAVVEDTYWSPTLFTLLRETMVNDYDIATLPIGIGKSDADILAVAPLGKYRVHIMDILDSHYSRGVRFDWISWIDGWGHEGFRVEQHLEKGIKSNFLGGDTVKLITYHRGNSEVQHTRYSAIDRNAFDFLLDNIEGKVWVKGEPTTSKELPSQKGVVALLFELLPKIGQTVPNNVLKESPYKNYRNELQSKLIGPLEKLLTQRTKKKLGLTITGGLTQFTVTFEPKGLKIGVVEKT